MMEDISEQDVFSTILHHYGFSKENKLNHFLCWFTCFVNPVESHCILEMRQMSKLLFNMRREGAQYLRKIYE